MALFTVRVELHNASGDDYDVLHERMSKNKFNRFVSGVDASGNKGIWRLPTAEYDYDGEQTAQQVRDLVKAIADGVRPKSWVLVTEVKTRSWNTEKLRSAS